MAPVRHPLGRAASLRAGSVGRPGQRRFFLLLGGERGSARLWLEKEHLLRLAMGIWQVLAAIPPDPSPSPPPAPQEGEVTLERRVDRLTLGYDEELCLFSLLAYEEDEEEATVAVWADRGQLEALAEEALAVCSAGRPLCPLCHTPLEPGPHHCPRRDGEGRAGPLG